MLLGQAADKVVLHKYVNVTLSEAVVLSGHWQLSKK